MLITFLLISGGILALVWAGIQRNRSSETLFNGFMDVEKGEEVAPTVFETEEK